MDDLAVRERVARIESLLARIEELPDTGGRGVALDAVGALAELFGEGLARIVAHMESPGEGGVPPQLVADELVSHLLLLYGLHPRSLEERVVEAVDGLRTSIAAHGAGLEVLEVRDGAARLRLRGITTQNAADDPRESAGIGAAPVSPGSGGAEPWGRNPADPGDNGPAAMKRLKATIEQALQVAAPDLDRFEIEGMPNPDVLAFVPLSALAMNGPRLGSSGPHRQ